MSLNDFSQPVRVRGCQFEGGANGAVLIKGSSSVGTPIEFLDNDVRVSGPGLGVETSALRVSGNHLVGMTQTEEAFGIAAMSLAQADGDFQVLDNQISGFATGIYVVQPPARTRIAGNQIHDGRIGISVIAGQANSEATVAIEANQVSDLGIPAFATPAATEAITGIFVFGASGAHLSGNTLRRIGVAAAAAGTTILGVIAYNCVRAQLTDNDVLDLAPADAFAGAAVGVGAFLPYVDLDMSGNRVRRSSTSTTGDTSIWGGLYAGLLVQAPKPTQIAAASVAKKRSKASTAAAAAISHFSPIIKIPPITLPPVVPVVLPGSSGGQTHGPTPQARPTAQPDAVSVVARGNQVVGLGLGACAALSGTSVSFVDNQCQRFTGSLSSTQQLAAPVILVAMALTASHNIVDGAEDRQLGGPLFTSIQLTPLKDGRVTVLGNHTSGQITVGSAALGAPWAPLNMLL